jgi:predicted transcriptional regulator
MDKTLTIRLDRKQQAALAERAKALGTTRSAVVRELIARGLEQQPQARRIGHLKGGLDVPVPKAGWARTIKERNWR